MFQRNLKKFCCADCGNMQTSDESKIEEPALIALDVSTHVPATIPRDFHDCFFGIFTGYAGRYYSDTVAIASLSFEPPPEQPLPSKRVARLNELLFKAVPHSHDCFLGKLHRDSITGSIVFEDVSEPDPFEYIDLAGRTQIKGTVQDIVGDDRLFKVKPLIMRSWVYQNMFDIQTSSRAIDSELNSGASGSLRSLNTIRERSLTVPLIDSETRIPACYSSSLAVMLSLAVASFSLDKTVFVVLLLLLVLTIMVSQETNTYASFKRERPITFLFRAATSAWILSLGLQPYIEYYRPVYSSNIPWILRMVSGIILAADIFAGDVRQIASHAFRSNQFRIRKTFPNNPRIFLCEENNPTEPNPILPEWINPDQSARVCLIVDINGILHRLYPVTGESDLPNPITTSLAINMASITLSPYPDDHERVYCKDHDQNCHSSLPN